VYSSSVLESEVWLKSLVILWSFVWPCRVSSQEVMVELLS